jgi:hypothetical protein
MTWTHWVNGLLGIWVVALAFIGFTGAALTWTMVITGIVIAVLGFMGAGAAQQSKKVTPTL